MEIFEYRYAGLVLTGWDVERVLSACPRGEALVENRSRTARVECNGDTICVDSVCFERPVERLEPGMLYWVWRGSLRPVEARDGGYLRLRAPGDGVTTTLEIDGVHMHRVEGVDPWTDTLSKVRAARVRRGDVVLDTCMGLGYTAIASVLRGARRVDTFEVDERVIWAAERNPHSRLLDAPNIHIFHGDVTEAVRRLPDEEYTVVIHDPPRFSRSTGDLYSLEFYQELYRVLRLGGRLFHYTGRPHGGRILQGIARRLQQAGFVRVRWVEEAQGFIAVKPR
ncbi:RsmD family RNA methyltransferase [Pyrolobus fumarii]|uniref:RsmD family RNA methyltransferase n=1 Tax=Pyrolobus fumarii TaxID=54252 RepID=UPI001432EC86|nr:RsmD family RNA methyltransferase [Pyrolobus fumarii]